MPLTSFGGQRKMADLRNWVRALSALAALTIAAMAAPSYGQAAPPEGFVLEFPLKCGDPDCAFRYDLGFETPASINSMLDHSLKQGSNGFWQYGSVAKGSADGVIVAMDGTRFDGKPKASDATCIAGAFADMPGQVLDFSALMNSSGCGAGFLSYDEHPGYDFRAAVNTPVFASAAGTVVNIKGQRCIIGNMGDTCDDWGFVGLDHGNGYVSQYGHLGRIDVQAGQTVAAGQQIGLSGSKSPRRYNLGAHLHFELLYKSGADYLVVDPYGWWGVLDDPLYSAAKVTPAFLWKRSGPWASAAKPAQSDVLLSRTSVVMRTKAPARLRDRPSATGTSIIKTLPAGQAVAGLWVQGTDPSTRWLKAGDQGYIWDGNLIDAIISLGPDLPSFKTRTRNKAPVFKYELGAEQLVYTTLARDEFHVWRVEKNPAGDGYICRVSVWGAREWWANCANLETPPGGWDSFRTVGTPDDLLGPLEDSNFPRGYMAAYRNYLAMLPLDRTIYTWADLEVANISPPIALRMNGKDVLHISGCQPHDCAANRTDIFLGSDRVTVKAILTVNGRQTRIGGAGPVEAKCLRKLADSGWMPTTC